MKITLPVTKGIIFAGCSFTWGQGLYYYSNLPTLIDAKNSFNPMNVSYAQAQYTKSLRYPRQVATHFNTFEIVHPLNGGSHSQTIKWWEASLGFSSDTHVDSNFVPKVDISEISTVVFQLTQPHRCSGVYFDDGTNISYNDLYLRKYRENSEKWLQKNGITIESYEEYYSKKSLESVKNFLIKCESHGLKTVILNWPKENVRYIKEDQWILEHFMPLRHGNNSYYDMDTLMVDYPEMKISSDYQNFQIPPEDDHPSLACHNMISENLINYLKNDKT